DLFRRDLPGEDLAEQAVLSHRHSLPAGKTVAAAGQWSDGCERTQGLTAGGCVNSDVVVAEAAHPVGEAAVPDHLQIPFDETCLVGSALALGLSLQPVAAFFADRVVHRQAEPGRGRSGSG